MRAFLFGDITQNMTKPYQMQANQSTGDRCRLNFRVYPKFDIWHKLFVSHALENEEILKERL